MEKREKKYLLPQNGNFYKANLHSHSNVSDGVLSPAEMKELYMSMGYSIIAFTDHNVMIPHPELADENFLPLNGYELDISSGGPKTCHIGLIALEPDNLKQVCWHREKYLYKNALLNREKVQFYEDEPDYEREHTTECINDMLKKGREHGFFVTYNHPTWSLEDYNDYINYENMHAMEIFNYSCMLLGYDEYNPRVYDDMLRAGKRIFCIAADDNHNYRQDSGGGFIVVKAEKLEYRTITKALEAGNFYASQGPEIYELWYEDGKVCIKCSPAARIVFSFADRASKNFSSQNEGDIEYAETEVKDTNIYVRITVIDREGKRANTNAYFLDELIGR